MADITINTDTIRIANVPRVAGWIYVFPVTSFWLYAYRSPLAAQSPYNGGIAYKRIPLTPAGTNPTVFTYPTFDIPSTEDAVINPNGARWGFFIFSDDDEPRFIMPVADMESIRITSSPSVQNLADIVAYQTTTFPPVTNGDRLVLGDLYAVNGIFSGNVTAVNFVGNGSGLTGIGVGTGGVINTGSTTIGADSDANGTGIVSLQTRNLERARVDNDGKFVVLGAFDVAGLSTFSLGASIPGAKQISWTTANVAAPSLTDNTIGSRLKLHDAAAPDHTAIGLESGAGWFQTADANAWKFYYAAVLKHTLTKSGLTLSGSLTVPRISSDTSNIGAPSLSDQTTGTRFNYYPAASGEHFAVGVESSYLWHNVSAAGGYRYYFGAQTGTPTLERHTLTSNEYKVESEAATFTLNFLSDFVGATALIIGASPGTIQFHPEGGAAYEMSGTSLLPLTDNSFDLGETAKRWKDVYVVKIRYSATVFDAAGTGTPEGAVTAGIGSTYRRTNGGAATSLYVKESGAGNTGWVGK